MKILVFSDSHGDVSSLEEAAKREEVNTDLIIHLGDGMSDIGYVSSLRPAIPCISLQGNSESFFKDDTRVFNEGDVRILCTHGHAYGVKGGLGRLLETAYEKSADLVLYGHTHIPFDGTYELHGKKIRIFNPGSIGRGFPQSYGVIRIKNGAIDAQHLTLDK